MNTTFKKLALAAVTLSGLSLAALSIASAPAEARVVCDRDGDDCRQVPGWYDRDDRVVCDRDGDDCRRVGGYDRDDYWRWRRHEWEERHEGWGWGNRTTWSAPYYRSYNDYYRPSGGSVWFGF